MPVLTNSKIPDGHVFEEGRFWGDHGGATMCPTVPKRHRPTAFQYDASKGKNQPQGRVATFMDAAPSTILSNYACPFPIFPSSSAANCFSLLTAWARLRICSGATSSWCVAMDQK